MPNPLDIPLQRLESAIQQAKNPILAKANAIGLEFFHQNFQKQGWQGEVFIPWKKREDHGKKSKGRKVLVLTAKLLRSLRGEVKGNEVIWHAGGPGIPYAEIHNEGGIINHPGGDRTLSFRRTQKGQMRFTKEGGRYKTIAMAKVSIGAHNIAMPRRHYMGDSPILRTRIEKMMLNHFSNAFK